VSPTDFYVQKMECQEKLTDLAEQLSAEYGALNDKEHHLSAVAVGSVCCARYTADGTWYRAVVEQVDGNNVCVIFVDYGNKDTVPLSDSIKELTSKYTSLPPFAYRCCLQDVSCPTEGWADKDIQKFVDATMSDEDSVLTCTFVGKDRDHFLVMLHHDSVDIKKLFEHSVFEVARKVDVPDSNDELASSRPVDVRLVYAETPASFYIQLLDQQGALKSLSSDLKKSAETAANIANENAHVGKLCACLYAEDDTWYRAVITDVQLESSTISVQFVDYGNGAEKIHVDALKELTAELMEPSYFAVHCKLHGLPSCIDSCYTKEAGLQLMNMYSEKTLQARFKSVVEPRIVQLLYGDEDILASFLARLAVDYKV
jgi:tudor domain-containing protein 1/4/6/7